MHHLKRNDSNNSTSVRRPTRMSGPSLVTNLVRSKPQLSIQRWNSAALEGATEYGEVAPSTALYGPVTTSALLRVPLELNHHVAIGQGHRADASRSHRWQTTPQAGRSTSKAFAVHGQVNVGTTVVTSIVGPVTVEPCHFDRIQTSW